MLPAEKAHQLVTTFYGQISSPNSCDWCLQCQNTLCRAKWKNAVDLAIIAVDEILLSFNSFMDSRRYMRHELEIDAERYWQQVKVELENIK